MNAHTIESVGSNQKTLFMAIIWRFFFNKSRPFPYKSRCRPHGISQHSIAKLKLIIFFCSTRNWRRSDSHLWFRMNRQTFARQLQTQPMTNFRMNHWRLLKRILCANYSRMEYAMTRVENIFYLIKFPRSFSIRIRQQQTLRYANDELTYTHHWPRFFTQEALAIRRVRYQK